MIKFEIKHRMDAYLRGAIISSVAECGKAGIAKMSAISRI